MTKPDLILHIGTQKTGTTTIQSFLRDNRAVLRSAGVLAPKMMHEPQAVRLAACCDRSPWPVAGAHFGVTSPEDLEVLRRRTLARLDARLSARSFEKVVISNEHLHSHVLSPEQLVWLQGLATTRFGEVRPVVYFRRQDRLAVSRYSTALRAGFADATPFDLGSHPWHRYYFDHRAVHRMWRDAFGAERVTVRLFERRLFPNQNVIDDFLEATDLPRDLDYRVPSPTNEALSADAAALIRVLNRRYAAGDIPVTNRGRRDLAGFLEERYPGAAWLPARESAEAFYASFAAGNDALRAELGRESWFDEDFSMYPEAHDPAVEEERARWAVDEFDRVLPELLAEAARRRESKTAGRVRPGAAVGRPRRWNRSSTGRP